MNVPSVVIVGGGIAGLAAAWELTGAQNGPDASSPRVEVIEASDHFGGTLVTSEFAGRTVDLGPDGFLARRPEALQLVRELGIEDQLEAINASGASIWLRGALDTLPEGLVLGIPTSSKALSSLKGLTWRARLAARRDQWLPRRLSVNDNTTIGEIVRVKLGRELSYQFIEPMVGGIQAGRIDDLSAKAVFAPLLAAAKRGGSLMKAMRPTTPASPHAASGPLFCSLTRGVGSLPEELVRQLRARGVVFRSTTPVTALRRTPSGTYPWEVDTDSTTTLANALILATPAPLAARLVGELHPALARLATIPSAGAAMITFDVTRANITLPAAGTGVLVPLGTTWSGEGTMMVTALTFLDRKWPRLQRDEDVLFRAHVGRIDDERWAAMSDDELVERVTKEVRELLGRFEGPRASMVQRWPNGLPQYYPGHDEMATAAKEAGGTFALALAGSAYDGVGIPASIGSGRRAARETLALLSKAPR
ncbi:MAG: protoporphyrinogen oxidase [Acidobacteria bacterium]|nr:protoporphyrinogen oxidase [Acidobacteriota bacterium]